MLTITPLCNAEYLISSVALSIDEYYAGVGESQGVWTGAWAESLGLSGFVEADELRALVEGCDPGRGVDLLAGHRDRKVMAFDLTFSAPKSVSLLWALGSEPVTEVIAGAHREAVDVALGFLEERAAVARIQIDGVRRRVGTEGWVVAGFTHRTSREGDPQLHTHCLVPNLVRRTGDGRHVAFDANPLHDWCRAAGSIYQNELQRSLSRRLGVVWGPDRHNTREIEGFTRKQLQAFSKRSVQIEAELEREGARYQSPALRMKADDVASLATRTPKDHSLTPSLLLGRWQDQATEVRLAIERKLERAVCFHEPDLSPPRWEELVAVMVDEECGVCARSARFTEADVVEHLCAVSGGRLTVDEITEVGRRFLSSDLAVRLVPEVEEGRQRRPPEWSTAAHRALEDDTVARLEQLIERPGPIVSEKTVTQALAVEGRLGDDQVAAVRTLTAEGGSVRCVLAPAGYGKTAMAHAAATAAVLDGRPVIAVATTAKAVAELAEAGLAARTIAQLGIDLQDDHLAPGTVVIVDEISQTPTRDAHTVLAAVSACRDGMAWILGDPRQSGSVAAGGMADEIQRLAESDRIPAARLTLNRRQVDPADRKALHLLRQGHAAASQHVRNDHGWEHEHATPGATRKALADALCQDIAKRGASQVVALTVSHSDAEDLADRVRHRLASGGMLTGRNLVGPGWSTDREYRAGDRILLHARCGERAQRLFNGATGTVDRVTRHGLDVVFDDGRQALLSSEFVQGTRRDGSPNLSHAWARTVDGAQGGTWECAHLLGTSALDAFRGYAGQSRSRQPTHTWNVAKVPELDHGGILAETRGPAEQVAAALDREPDPRLAARRDPYILERQLLERIEAHQAVLFREPADRAAALAQTEEDLVRARAWQHNMEAIVTGTTRALDQLGALTGLLPSGRRERRQLESKLAADHDAARQAQLTTAQVEATLAELRDHQAERDRFEAQHRWRREHITALRAELDHHWTDVVMACVQADDPLAYGIDKLRAARSTLKNDLWQLDATIPPDRSHEWNHARRQLTVAVQARQHSQQLADTAQRQVDEAGLRRWGRRDQEAVTRAKRELSSAEADFKQAVKAETNIRKQLSALTEHDRDRRHRLDQTHRHRVELSGALEQVSTALTDTRPERVKALAVDPPEHMIRLLGGVPDNKLGRETWLYLADKYEAQLDMGKHDHIARQAVAQDLGISTVTLARLPELAAEQQTALTEPAQRHQSLERNWQPLPRPLQIDRGIGPEIGM